jgi:hypothetical protein
VPYEDPPTFTHCTLAQIFSLASWDPATGTRACPDLRNRQAPLTRTEFGRAGTMEIRSCPPVRHLWMTHLLFKGHVARSFTRCPCRRHRPSAFLLARTRQTLNSGPAMLTSYLRLLRAGRSIPPNRLCCYSLLPFLQQHSPAE